MKESIPLMKPFMPPRKEFDHYLDRIWRSGRLTNNGPIHSEFLDALKAYFGVEHISLAVNGTMALFLALRGCRLKGEVITTPFTSVATLQAILMNGMKPVYADIDPATLNLDPVSVKKQITKNTCAILPVHVFGQPCDVDAISAIANSRNLQVIYDAAHCFGASLHGRAICSYGDVSVVSLHATKVINSIEGGIIICRDAAVKELIDVMKDVSQEKGQGLLTEGFNGKMNEFQAAFGLIQLRYINDLVNRRKLLTHAYCKLLSAIPGIRLLNEKSGVTYNYSFMPIIIEKEIFGVSRDAVAEHLAEMGISTRKYFHPLISDLPGQTSTGHLPVAQKISSSILCLPLYPELEFHQVEYIVDSIKEISGML